MYTFKDAMKAPTIRKLQKEIKIDAGEKGKL